MYSKCTIDGYNYYKVQISMPNGKRKTLYGKTIAELREKEAAFREEMKKLPGKSTYTVAQYAALQLELFQPHIQRGTYIGYEEKIRLYIAAPPLGEKPIDAVVPDDISRALARVAPLSESTYRGVVMLLRRIFGTARRNHLISDDPTDGISSKGGRPATEKTALTNEEVGILLDSVKGLRVETFILLGLYAGLRREEILGLQWDCVFLDGEHPYIQIRRAWRIANNRPIVSEELKTPAARRDIPIPPILADHLRAKKVTTTSDYVIANREGAPLSGSQWRNLWKQVSTRCTAERTYSRYIDGKKITHVVSPKLGEHALHNPDVVYAMDFKVTPHQLRRTYISNLIYAGLDPKTVQFLAGHENSKITMDIYAKIKYNRPEDIAPQINGAFEGTRD
ncbi:tyrosine-type recombinase/integrase [uncultured Oscillibacter sp.]|uniref:tyrosine-type recombinase/integrase n=1 Tax=uncultured Oscillibacter sp. TaxID=876091 RepID=UPI0025D2D81C|nr:tyrosine-type recombinase/integrase [uncultured Oscillibacter sp.]